MSDEPRTDAIVHRRICYGATRNDMKVIEAFARQLERELAAKDKEIADANTVIANMTEALLMLAAALALNKEASK